MFHDICMVKPATVFIGSGSKESTILAGRCSRMFRHIYRLDVIGRGQRRSRDIQAIDQGWKFCEIQYTVKFKASTMPEGWENMDGAAD